MDQQRVLVPQEKWVTQEQIRRIANAHEYEYAAVRAIHVVEAAGKGYDPATGKIKIQFEPHWYAKLDAEDGFSGHGVWENNKVERQGAEWIAFNDAFAKDADAAMRATSWGAMQVMGFHFKTLGFDTVGAMVDFAKESEANQIELGIRLIQKSPRLDAAMKARNWKNFAYYYNGPKYKDHNYDVNIANAYADASGG